MLSDFSWLQRWSLLASTFYDGTFSSYVVIMTLFQFRQFELQVNKIIQLFYSDRPLFRQVNIPKCHYSDRSLFRQVYLPTGRYSDRSISRQIIIPTDRYSDSSIFRHVIIPTGREGNGDYPLYIRPINTEYRYKIRTKIIVD